MTETSLKASVRVPLLALAAVVTVVVVLDENRANLVVKDYVKDYGCSWILNPGWHDLLSWRFQGVEVFTKTLNYRFMAT